MKRPSREKVGTSSLAGWWVIWRSPEPEAPIVQMSTRPFSALESKTIT